MRDEGRGGGKHIAEECFFLLIHNTESKLIPPVRSYPQPPPPGAFLVLWDFLLFIKYPPPRRPDAPAPPRPLFIHK